jgi:hypothetical protein
MYFRPATYFPQLGGFFYFQPAAFLPFIFVFLSRQSRAQPAPLVFPFFSFGLLPSLLQATQSLSRPQLF